MISDPPAEIKTPTFGRAYQAAVDGDNPGEVEQTAMEEARGFFGAGIALQVSRDYLASRARSIAAARFHAVIVVREILARRRHSPTVGMMAPAHSGQLVAPIQVEVVTQPPSCGTGRLAFAPGETVDLIIEFTGPCQFQQANLTDGQRLPQRLYEVYGGHNHRMQAGDIITFRFGSDVAKTLAALMDEERASPWLQKLQQG